MLEKRMAESAEAKPQGNADAAPRSKGTVTKPGSRTPNSKPAAAKRREDDMRERIQRRPPGGSDAERHRPDLQG